METFTKKFNIGNNVTTLGMIPILRWTLTGTLQEFDPGLFVTGYNYTTPIWTYTNSQPEPGTGAGNISGGSFIDKGQELKIILQPAFDACTIRIVFLQLLEDSWDFASLTLNEFFQSPNITSYYRNVKEDNQTFKFKVLVDKTIRLGDSPGEGPNQRNLTVKFTRGQVVFPQAHPIYGTSQYYRGPGRIVYGLYCDRIAGGDLADFPKYYGNYKFQYCDDQ